jgi:hypothetical protein
MTSHTRIPEPSLPRRTLLRRRIQWRHARTGVTVANEFTPLNVAFRGGRNCAH